MARNASETSKRKAENEDGTQVADDVDKIRDIIFGGQMREYASRFEQMEKAIIARVDRLGADLDKRIAQLNNRLDSEKEERKTADTAIRNQIRDSEKQLKATLAESGEGWASEAVELHNTLIAESEELVELIEKSKAELIKNIESEIARVDQQKIATRDLAQLFADLGRDLKQEAK